MKVLVVAPHRDDEVLGVGGTIARFVAEQHDVVIGIMTGHGSGETHPLYPSQEQWARLEAEANQAYAVLGVRETIRANIPTVLVSEEPIWRINRVAEQMIRDTRPDVLFVPFLFDMHHDHRELVRAFSVAWRPSSPEGRNIRQILAYETVSESHWGFPGLEPAFAPNVWIDISRYLPKKLESLKCFESQMQPSPATRSLQAVEALARFRGSQIAVEAAEGFVLLRQIW